MRQCPSCGAEYFEDERFCPMDGSPLDEVSDAQAGSAVGHRVPFEREYELGESLGRDELGEVFIATDRTTGLNVAVKRFDAWTLESSQSLQRYAATLARLKEEPVEGVPLVVSYEMTSTEAFLASELIEDAVTLERFIADRGAVPLDEAIQIISGVLDVLRQLHTKGIVHGGMTPRKVLLSNGPDPAGVVLTDPGQFELWRDDNPIQTSRKEPERFLGVAQYYSPEAAMGQPVTPSADLYTVGLLFYETLAGKPPFSAHSFATTLKRQIYERPLPARLTRPGLTVPPEVESLIECALAKRPDGRFDSAQALYNAVQNLKGMVDDSSVTPAQEALPDPAERVDPAPDPDVPAETPSTQTSQAETGVARDEKTKRSKRSKRRSSKKTSTESEPEPVVAKTLPGATATPPQDEPAEPQSPLAGLDGGWAELDVSRLEPASEAPNEDQAAPTDPVDALEAAFDRLEEELVEAVGGELAAGELPEDAQEDAAFVASSSEHEVLGEGAATEAIQNGTGPPAATEAADADPDQGRLEVPLTQDEEPIAGLSHWFDANPDDIRDTLEGEVPFVDARRWNLRFGAALVLFVAVVVGAVMVVSSSHGPDAGSSPREAGLASAESAPAPSRATTPPVPTPTANQSPSAQTGIEPTGAIQPAQPGPEAVQPVPGSSDDTADGAMVDDSEAPVEEAARAEPEQSARAESERTEAERAQAVQPEAERPPPVEEVAESEEHEVVEDEPSAVTVGSEAAQAEEDEQAADVEAPSDAPPIGADSAVEGSEPAETAEELEPEPTRPVLARPVLALIDAPEEPAEATEAETEEDSATENPPEVLLDPEAQAAAAETRRELSRELARRGEEALAETDYEGAELLFRQAVESDDRNARAYAGLGDVFFQRGDFGTARRYHSRAVTFASRNATFHSRLGMDYFRLGRYDDAIASWERTLELDASDQNAARYIDIARERLAREP